MVEERKGEEQRLEQVNRWMQNHLRKTAEEGMEYRRLTEKIIACAYRVYNKMGFGYLESVYEKCLLIELHKSGLHAEPQKSISVFYGEEKVGDFIADIIVDNTVILELKSVRRIADAHEVQLVNYLVATNKPVGLLLNFGERKVEVKRKLRELN
jgi:GxxExxY protein